MKLPYKGWVRTDLPYKKLRYIFNTYTKEEILILGSCTVTVQYKEQTQTLPVIVVPGMYWSKSLRRRLVDPINIGQYFGYNALLSHVLND